VSTYVHVHTSKFWGSAEGRASDHVEWREGLTVANVLPRAMVDKPGLAVHVNGRRVDSCDWFVRTLSPWDHVDVGVRPAGPGVAIGAALTTALVSAGVSIGISIILRLLLPKPKGPKKRGDDESPTYTWSGKENNRVEGQPRPVEYGELRYAPYIVDQFTVSTQVPPETYLYVLMLLGEGPYEDVGGVNSDNPIDRPLTASDHEYPLPKLIEINGNPISNFRGIEAHVRLGSDDQDPIPGFEEIHTVSDVSLTLDQVGTTNPDNSATAWNLGTFPYNSNDPSVQAIWNAYAQAFDLPDEADAYTINVNFPQGLYRIDGNGNAQDAVFMALVRYKELHYLGETIDTGGDNGDGWIYAPPQDALIAHHQSAFNYQLSGLFYSSGGFTPGAQGAILEADLTGMGAYTSASNGGAPANAVTPWTTGQAIDAFTVECWYKPMSLPLTGTGVANTVRPIFEWMTSGPYRGVSLRLERVTTDVGEGATVELWRLRVYYGDGTTTLHHYDSDSSIINTFQVGVTHHIVFTWARNLPGHGGDDRVNIYVDGVLKFHFVDSLAELAAAAAPMRLLETTATPSGTVKGFARMDECRVWRTERTGAQVVADYNLGAGNFAMNSSELVAGWHFDAPDNLVNFSFASDISSNGNTITTEGGATIGDPTTQVDAVVYRPGGGSLKRAQYHVQVLRLNVKSTTSTIADESVWDSIDGRIDEQLSYPNSAMLALKIPASQQLNSSTPNITVVAKGRKVPIWDRVSTTTPAFTDTWTPNPAWILYDMLTNTRFGGGADFSSSNVDLVSFAEAADYCDEKVYDGLGRVNIHETDTSQPIADILFDTTMNGGVGGLQVQFRTGFIPPGHWVVARWLGFQDLPVSGGTISQSINENAVGMDGFQITDVLFSGGGWLINLLYPVATLGAPWADGTGIAAASGAAVVNGTVEGREERFRFDGVFDSFQKIWDCVLAVTTTCRAMPVLEGSRFRLRLSKPRSPVGLVTMGSILPGSFKVTYTSKRERPNMYVTDFLDRDRDWAQKPAQRGAPSLDAGASESAINRENIEVHGLTRRSQVLRHMDFMLAVNETLTRQVEWIAGIDALEYEVGDVVAIAHDLVPWGKSGTFPAACIGTTIVLERPIVLAPATTYFLQIRHNASGQIGSGSSVSDYLETRQITSVAGTYAAGASITITSSFTIDPAKNDPWLVYATSEQVQVEIGEITLDDKYNRKVTAVQYDASVYDVDLLTSDIPSPVDPPPDDLTAPGPVENLQAVETQGTSGTGATQLLIKAAWTLEATTAGHVGSVVIWTRLVTSPGIGAPGVAWGVAATLSGPAVNARFAPTPQSIGSVIEVAIQPVSSGGARLDIALCSKATVSLTAKYQNPPGPLVMQATMDGELVTYTFQRPPNDQGNVYELRRGGWLAGQVVGVSAPGDNKIGPTRDWAASKDNLNGAGPPPLVLRARDGRGQYSSAYVLTGFNPSVPGAAVLTGSNVVGKKIGGSDTRYEDWGIGWVDALPNSLSPVPNGVEVVTIVDGRKILQISSPNLTGTYETGANVIAADSVAEFTFVEAFVTADQVPPITADQETLGADDPLAARRSAEGVIDDPKCTLLIEWCFRKTTSEAYSAYQAFKPGRYYILDAKFRITVTRPDATWNVRMYSFGTRFSRAPRTRFQTDDITRRFAGRFR
jgi:hypothetical protein